MKYEAVLFDLDGVLLKSMEQHLEAWQHAFSRFKANIEERHFFQLEGRGVRSVVEILTERYGIDPKFRQSLTDDKVAYYNSRFKVEFYDGIYPLLDMLHDKNIKMGIVTGGLRDRVEKIKKDYFKNYFSAVVTSDDVKNTKPFPEPYLKGAELLNTQPEHCVVIENAPMGIKSGKEAGMFVVAITTTMSKEYLKEADVITDSFFEIEDYLTQNEKILRRV